MTTNYGNIISIIKNYIINANIRFMSKIDGNDTISNWKIKKFEEPYNEMFSDDLVTNVSSYMEDKIYIYTKEILQDIEEQLKKQNKLCQGEKIVFTIVRNIHGSL
jgi:hypothetical protein